MNILLVIMYFLGLVITTSLVVTWFNTNFPLKLWALFGALRYEHSENDDDEDKPETWEDWELLVYMQTPLLSELVTCTLCLGAWFAGLVAIIIILVNGLTWWFLPAAVFSWPLLAFYVQKHLTKERD